MIKGTQIKLGDTEYMVPTLNFDALQEREADIAVMLAIAGIPKKPEVQAFVRVVHAALARNYPDLTVEQVAKVVDLSNFTALLKAVVSVNALDKAPPAGEAGAGSL